MPIVKFNPFTPSFKYVWSFGWHQEVKELIQNERILLFLFLDLVVSQVRWNNFGPRILGARDEGNNLHYHDDLILTHFVPISPLFQCLLIFVAIVELKGINPFHSTGVFLWPLKLTSGFLYPLKLISGFLVFSSGLERDQQYEMG